MEGRKLKGKTIRKVHQKRHAVGEHRAAAWSIEAIEFTDGSVLRLIALEGDFEHGVEGIYPARGLDEKAKT